MPTADDVRVRFSASKAMVSPTAIAEDEAWGESSAFGSSTSSP